MTRTSTAISTLDDSEAAARDLSRQLLAGLDTTPDAIVLFASARYDHARLLGTLLDETGGPALAGASSAGEFTHTGRGAGAVSALAIASDRMSFSVGHGTDLRADPRAAARSVAASFEGHRDRRFPYHAALVMTDALAGHADLMLEELTLATGGNYRFFGGGAGDDGNFRETYVFAGDRILSNAVIALEIRSAEPLGIGVSHGWVPASEGLRVTEVDGPRIVSLNGLPAIHAFEDHARATGQSLDRDDPLPYFLHNILGIEDQGEHRLRVPLGVDEQGAVSCAAEVPEGSIVHIMKTSEDSAVDAARAAASAALANLGPRRAAAGLVFDCVATRLRLGAAFSRELDAAQGLLSPAGMVGCNTYGQIARAEGQFSGFHNCTAVVCVLPG